MLLGEEVSQLQKALRDFTCDLTQAQSQLEATQREKSVLLSKSLELEKMHVQMKEHMGADIHYLRQLNLQLVERQVKGEGERGIRRRFVGGWSLVLSVELEIVHSLASDISDCFKSM